MSDDDRLNAVLGKLGQGTALPQPDGADARSVLVGLLKAIDETVLPRDLQVVADDVSITLHVAKRRLLSVSGMVEAELAEADEGTLTALGDEIADLLIGREVKVTAVRPDEEVDPSAVGASVNKLASAWAASGAPPASVGDLVAGALAAIHWLDGEEYARSGDGLPDDVPREDLRHLLKGDRAALATARAGDETAMVFVADGGEEALLLLPLDQVSGHLRGWA